MNSRSMFGMLTAVVLLAGTATTAYAADARVARGRYLVEITGCNDCHTPGFGQKNGQVPEQEWLTGVPVGYQGPWGTSYPANLRLIINSMSEAQWLKHARQERMPPMPWYSLRAMSDADVGAIYAYVRSLGPAGVATPAYVAPGGKVSTPYFVFVPQVDAKQAAAR